MEQEDCKIIKMPDMTGMDYYTVDFDQVRSIEDIKLIFSSLGVGAFLSKAEYRLSPIRKFLTEIEYEGTIEESDSGSPERG